MKKKIEVVSSRKNWKTLELERLSEELDFCNDAIDIEWETVNIPEAGFIVYWDNFPMIIADRELIEEMKADAFVAIGKMMARRQAVLDQIDKMENIIR